MELDPLVNSLRSKVQRVDSEILAAVRQQSSSGGRARAELASAKATIEELFGKVHEIQRKAQQSELRVQEICRDIKKLDFAKKHLTATITALRRLSMLVNAVGACVGAGTGGGAHIDLFKHKNGASFPSLCPPTALRYAVPSPQTSCSCRWSATSTPRRRTCWRRCSSCPRTSRRTCTSPRWRSSRGGSWRWRRACRSVAC